MQTSKEYLSNVSTDSAASGVSWGAIFAGAAAAAALSLILLVLGVGLGFSTVSPWPNSGISAGTLGISTIIWLILTQLVASGLGGYLAGRLRTKWRTLHTNEVYFRDTAHGLLAWSVATLIVAALVGTVMSKTVSGIASAGSSMASTTLGAAGEIAQGQVKFLSSHHRENNGHKEDSSAENLPKYLIGFLFRADPTADSSLNSDNAIQTEAERILVNSLRSSNLPPEDAEYLAKIVSKHTGLSVEEAHKRVNETFDRLKNSIENVEKNARETADKARKATAYSALWMFVALLSGAFIASLLATLGGRQRDCVRDEAVV
jgi:uncharacterized membrane protein SpoIIM required for sporulation